MYYVIVIAIIITSISLALEHLELIATFVAINKYLFSF